MVATKDQIEFAQSRWDYFEKILKKGEGDKLKSLLKAIKAVGLNNDLKAQSIATAIKNAKTVTQTAKNKAIQEAKDALEKVTITDINATKTALVEAQTKVNTLVDKIDTANSLINGSEATDGEKQKVLEKLKFAKSNASDAKNKLANIDFDKMAKLTGDDLCKAIANAKTAISEAGESISGKDHATKNLQYATEEAGDIQNDAAKTDVISELTSLTDDGKEVEDAIGTTTIGLVQAVETAGTDCRDYESKQKVADAMVVGDDPVMTAAKALLGDTGAKSIKDATDNSAAKDVFVNQAPTFLKDYGFINAILKNLPNKATGVLEVVNNVFGKYCNNYNDANGKMADYYAKTIATVCGTGPFVTEDDLPEKDVNSHHVKSCLAQANKIAYTILSVDECGNDKLDNGNVKDACYKGLADKANDLYNNGKVDELNIALDGKYPDDVVSVENSI